MPEASKPDFRGQQNIIFLPVAGFAGSIGKRSTPMTTISPRTIQCGSPNAQ
jgi:hypothetical protein